MADEIQQHEMRTYMRGLSDEALAKGLRNQRAWLQERGSTAAGYVAWYVGAPAATARQIYEADKARLQALTAEAERRGLL